MSSSRNLRQHQGHTVLAKFDFYGKYRIDIDVSISHPNAIYPFDIEKESKRISLRPLRKPSIIKADSKLYLLTKKLIFK